MRLESGKILTRSIMFNETETFKLSAPHRVDLKQSDSPVSVEESL